MAVLADDILVSLGGYSGKKDFVRHWKLDRPKSSLVWTELGTALSLGCAVQSDVRVVPSFEAQIDSSREPFETLIAFPGSLLRREASDRSPAITKLNWHVLTMRKPWDGGAWVAVTLDGRRHGFLRRNLTRSPLDYRASFRKIGGKWRMTTFIAGD